jgi:hypothetical protein
VLVAPSSIAFITNTVTQQYILLMRSLRFVVRTGLLSAGVVAQSANNIRQFISVNRRCEPIDYYYEFLQTETAISRWARDDLEDLLRTTHSQVTPFFGSEAGQDDVLEALIEMDSSSLESINLFYSDLDAPRYPLDRSGWVPEHVCPVFMSTVVQNEFDAAFSDLHNIRPVHPILHESARGTQFFGVCPTCIELLEQGSNTCICGDFFQPPDSVRGVVARAWLYMQLRYPDVPLSNCHLEQLLAWHLQHPPTQEERNRNDRICSEWQGNRNPFVDFPELAFSIRVQESSCDTSTHHGDINGGNDHGFNSGNLLGSLPVIDTNDNDLEDGNLELEVDTSEDISHERDWNFGNTPLLVGPLPTVDVGDNDLEDGDLELDTTGTDGTDGGDIWDNIFTREGEDVDYCAELMPGDIYFYVMQASPSRMGFIPLIDLPKNLTLYMSDTLSFASSTSMVRIANDIPDTPMLRITLEEDMVKGNPFGYGRNLLLGYDWEVVTEPITVRGKAIGGDELFLFCYDNQDQLRLLSALTTNGSFQDAETSEFLLNKGFGKVILPEPMDYYVYNGPHYSINDSYQRALMNPFNWLGFDLSSPPDTNGGGSSGTTDDFFAKPLRSSGSMLVVGGWTTILILSQCLATWIVT